MSLRLRARKVRSKVGEGPPIASFHLDNLLKRFSELTRECIINFRFHIPVLMALLLDGATESPFDRSPSDSVATKKHGGSFFKIYRLSDMLSDPER